MWRPIGVVMCLGVNFYAPGDVEAVGIGIHLSVAAAGKVL